MQDNATFIPKHTLHTVSFRLMYLTLETDSCWIEPFTSLSKAPGTEPLRFSRQPM